MNKNKSKRILHIAHHKIVDISQMQQLLDHQYGVQRRLGALPLSIIKNLKKEDIKELTEKADKILDVIISDKNAPASISATAQTLR